MELALAQRRLAFLCRSALALLIVAIAQAAVPEPKLNPVEESLPLVDGSGIRFTRITPADGLSQTRVAQIVQDDRGFIWFGTQHGLDRYDGYQFRVFLHDPQRPNSIAGNFIYALFKDRAGELWVGCAQSLDRYDPTTEEFRHFRLEPENMSDFPGPVVHIAEDHNGMLWLASASGLRRLDPRTGKIKKYLHDTADPASLPENDTRWVGEDKTGALWVGTSSSLDAFDPESGKVTLHISGKAGWQSSFYEDRSGRFWVLSATGLAVLDRRRNLLTRYTLWDRTGSRNVISGLMDMTEDREGDLWVGSTSIGLLRLDSGGHKFTHYRNNPGDPWSLAEDKVICLFTDREGNIWSGLHSKGPNRFNPSPTPFEPFRHEPGNRNSLETDFVDAIYRDREGALWIGSDKGLVRINRKTEEYVTFHPGMADPVIAIVGDGAGGLWLGTAGQGVTHFDPRTGRQRTYRHDPTNPSSLSNDRVHRLFVDRAGTLWAATDDGLDRFDSSAGNFKTYRGGTQSYVFIAEDERGLLWLGTNDVGLQRFDPRTEQFTQSGKKADASGAAGDGLVTGILVDGFTQLWLATYHGLESFDRSMSTYVTYGERSGLAGTAVSCMLPDSQGNIWMSTNRGISSFNPATKSFDNYSETAV